MKKPRALCKSAVCTDLVGDYSGDMRDLYRVIKHVLTVACTVTQASEQLYKLGIEPVNAGFKRCPFSGLLDDVIDLPALLFNGIL